MSRKLVKKPSTRRAASWPVLPLPQPSHVPPLLAYYGDTLPETVPLKARRFFGEPAGAARPGSYHSSGSNTANEGSLRTSFAPSPPPGLSRPSSTRSPRPKDPSTCSDALLSSVSSRSLPLAPSTRSAPPRRLKSSMRRHSQDLPGSSSVHWPDSELGDGGVGRRRSVQRDLYGGGERDAVRVRPGSAVILEEVLLGGPEQMESSSKRTSSIASQRSTRPDHPDSQRKSHYSTISSSSSATRRYSVQHAPAASSRSGSPQPSRRYSMPLPPSASSVPLPGSVLPTYRRRATTSTIRRKPVPALAIEDDVDTVDDPLWDGKTLTLPATPEDVSLEAKVRKMSLEETDGGATSLGSCLKESDAEERVEAEKGLASAMERQPSGGSVFVERFSLDSHSSSIFDTSAPAAANADGPATSPPTSLDLSSASTASSSTSPFAKRAFRPFALLRRQLKQPLPAHGTIIPSLASSSAPPIPGALAFSQPAKPKSATDDELVDAWMDIIVGEEEDEPEAEQSGLVSRSKRSRNESIASLASSVPPLMYASSSKPSSATSIVPHEQAAQPMSQGTSHVADIGVGPDGLDASFDVPTGRGSEEPAAKLALEDEPMEEVEMAPPAQDPVEAAAPSTKPPPSTSQRPRFSPITNRFSFSRAWSTPSPRSKDKRPFSLDLPSRRRKRSASSSFSPTSSSPPAVVASLPPSPNLGAQIASRTIPPVFSLSAAPQGKKLPCSESTPTAKRRLTTSTSRAATIDITTQNKPLPPLPPKSARLSLKNDSSVNSAVLHARERSSRAEDDERTLSASPILLAGLSSPTSDL